MINICIVFDHLFKDQQMLSLNNLKLRPMDETDLEMVLKWRNSDEVRQYMLSNAIIEPETHLNWFKKNSTDYTVELFIAEYETIPIGVVSITDIDSKNQTCTWGMYIGESFRNSGIGVLMQIRAIDRMVNIHNIRKIWGQALSSNRIIKMHEQFGFRKEGILELHIERNGNFEDILLVALFANQWPKNRQKIIDTFQIKEI